LTSKSITTCERIALDWRDNILAHFPDWGTDRGSARWQRVRESLKIGQAVSGTVIARAPFGVWLDIGVGFPALLLVPNMQSKDGPIPFTNYPAIGVHVEGYINAIGNEGEVGISQRLAAHGDDGD